MRLFLAIVIGLVALALLWRLLHWAIGMAVGLLYLALIVGAVVFVVGLVRRLLRA